MNFPQKTWKLYVNILKLFGRNKLDTARNLRNCEFTFTFRNIFHYFQEKQTSDYNKLYFCLKFRMKQSGRNEFN